jgi:hypothetical protein
MISIRKAFAALVAVALAASCSVAGAQTSTPATVPASATLGWVLPTVGSDSVTPLTGGEALTGVNIYVSTSAIPDAPTGPATITLSAASTTTAYSATVAVGSTLHFRLAACNAFGCSALTPEVTKVVTGSTPGIPTSVTVSIKITT